jgi:hypothetical protein
MPVVHTTQIECGHGQIYADDANRIRIVPNKEMLETDQELLVGGYNVCLQLANPNYSTTKVAIEIDFEDWFEEDWCRLPLRLPFWRKRAGEWQEADPGQRNSRHGVHLSLTLDAQETTVLSSIPHFTYTDCTREMRALTRLMPEAAHVVELGRTGEARAILALEIGAKQAARRIVVLGSTRPSEPAAWGVLAMARALLSDPALRPYLDQFQVCLIPQPNPDGIVHGRCFGNGSGRPMNMDWTQPPGAQLPETTAIWNYLKSAPPALVGQFEFAPVTTRRSDWPRPLSIDIYNPTSVALHDRLAEISGEGGGFAKDRRSPANLQIAYHAARQFGCAAFAYRYVGPTTTPKRAEARAVQVIETVLETLTKQ